MRRARLIAVAGCVLAVICSISPDVQAAGSTTASSPVRLQTGGGYFRDADGRVVLLHGVNLVDKGPGSTAYPDSDAVPNGFTASDADFLASSGFNFVRLGINWSQLVQSRPATPGVFVVDQTYLDKVVRVASLLASRHIYYMLDLHQDCFTEWPGWAIPWDQGDSTALPFPACQLIPAGVTRAFDNLFKNPDPDNALLPGGSLAVIPVAEVWTDYREVWRQVAQRFRDLDYLLGYDFMNEPGGSDSLQCAAVILGCRELEEKIQVFEQNALAGIREADPVSTVDPSVNQRAGIGMFEPVPLTGSSGAPTGLGDTPVTDPKVGYTWHLYCGSGEAINQDVGCADLAAAAFDGVLGVGGAARNAAHLTGADQSLLGFPRRAGAEPAPQLLGEFGSTTATSIVQEDVQLADAHFVSWAYWAYKDGSGGQDSMFSSQRDEQCVCFADPSPRADVLIHPYPQATAGLPLSYSYDATTRTMTYTYQPSGDFGLSTDIAVPLYALPNGYHVVVTNGIVMSPPGATTVSVRAIGASKVTVVIAPIG